MTDIKNIVDKIIKKYGTTSPYELSELMGIKITRCELGEIRGYYHHAYRVKQIYLNCNLSRNDEKLVLAHELGHVVLHPDTNTPFFKSNTLISVDKMEIQANTFAMYFLISDRDLSEYKDYSIEQLSKLYGYNKRLIELRLR